MTMEHRHQVEWRGSCGKVVRTRDLATASNGLKSWNANSLIASISVEILGSLWSPTGSRWMRDRMEGMQAILILSSNCSETCFSVAGTTVFANSIVFSVAGTDGAYGDRSKTMVCSVAGRNVHFQNDEGYGISCKK